MHTKNEKNHKKEEPVKDEQPQAPKEEVVEISKKELESLKLRADERDAFYDKYLRAHSEFENAKKRMEKDKVDFIRYANNSIILEFLPIVDSLEIAEKHIKEAKDFAAVREGVDMIQLQIQKYLKDIGVERIKSEGEKFDPHLHEALEIDEASDKEEGTIVAELKPGYMYNGRLIRPASVKIAKRKT